jgi:NADH dehydrogenase
MTDRHRDAKGGTLVIGGGFGGAYVARLLGRRGATVVNPDTAMLYTPMLPEVAAGAIEPRHVAVPLRVMCPNAELVRGRAVALDEDARTVSVETEVGPMELGYERLVIALGSVTRMLPIPGLDEHALPFKGLADAVRLRNHVLQRLEFADADPANAGRYLTFVFVGAGYAGVESLAELHQLMRETIRHYPRLRDVPQRWVLVDGAERILGEVPGHLGDYAARLLAKRGIELRLATTLASVDAGGAMLSDGTRIETETVVWTAGVTPNPLLRELGLPLDPSGRLVVDASLQVEGRANVWALGDCALVPNGATEKPDPPTCQHALRQARRLAKTLRGSGPKPYRYRSIGQGATLGTDKGIAHVMGLNMRGMFGATVTRAYHLYQLPLPSRRIRVVADQSLSRWFDRDMAEIGGLEPRHSASRAR